MSRGRPHAREQINTGHVVTNAGGAKKPIGKATDDGSQAVTAAMFWLETRAGQKEPSAGEEQEPIEIRVLR